MTTAQISAVDQMRAGVRLMMDAELKRNLDAYTDAVAAYPEDAEYFGGKLAAVAAEIARRGSSYHPESITSIWLLD